MKVGDLVRASSNAPVRVPEHTYHYQPDKVEIGVVVAIRQDMRYTRRDRTRVCVYWFDHAEKEWEPKRWLEVISAD